MGKSENSGETITHAPSIQSDDRELMKLAVDLAAKCVSEEGKVSPKVAAVVARGGVVPAAAYRGELKPGEHAEYTLLERKLSIWKELRFIPHLSPAHIETTLNVVY